MLRPCAPSPALPFELIEEHEVSHGVVMHCVPLNIREGSFPVLGSQLGNRRGKFPRCFMLMLGRGGRSGRGLFFFVCGMCILRRGKRRYSQRQPSSCDHGVED